MRSMRVLMISDVYFPRVTGVSTSIQTFARELGALGHSVTVMVPDYGARDYDAGTNEAFEIIRIPSRYLPIDPEDRILQPFKIRRLTETLRARQFDLVHIQTPFIAHYSGLALAKRLGVPVIESYHTFFEHYLYHYVPWVPASWMRHAARHFSTAQCNGVAGLVVPSQAMLAVLREYGINTPAEVIPTGIDLKQFSQGDGYRFRTRYGIAPERPVLVLVSRLAFEKNIAFILKALVRIKAEVPNVLLVVAGEGPAQQELTRLAEQLGLTNHTLFLGYLNRDGSLEDCYCAGQAFVFASRTETQGLVLLEAMALGVPVVSTAVMGTKEVLGDGQGALIAEEDEADFACKAVRLLTDATLRQRLAADAVAHAREWSAPVLAERLAQYYAQIVAQANTSRM
ncbi:Glycosyltransferase involved in cell wall bisynthesis [Allochromatium warmingii]|uniref:Glycosyltransferase involved in cell wall bisynthesis n=2 Tax=Allochromatium warmingii TaxID=61595 RepID=A0A1H3BJV5_ALLWA|nr:Glycosyltransferase involved in cell wall bisynthesis [Allochromatium warmingii]